MTIIVSHGKISWESINVLKVPNLYHVAITFQPLDPCTHPYMVDHRLDTIHNMLDVLCVCVVCVCIIRPVYLLSVACICMTHAKL